MFHIFLHKYSHLGIFLIFNMASKMAAKGHVTIYYWFECKLYILATFCENFTAIGLMVLTKYFGWVSVYVSKLNFLNNSNLFLTAKLLKQG